MCVCNQSLSLDVCPHWTRVAARGPKHDQPLVGGFGWLRFISNDLDSKHVDEHANLFVICLSHDIIMQSFAKVQFQCRRRVVG